MSLQDNKCDTCLNSRPIISENGIKYNCCFSSKRAIKCIMNNWCYYNEIKFNEDGSIKIVDIMGIELKW